MAFVRRFPEDAIKKLQDEPLFQNCLREDIENGSVFPAVRRDRMDFYHRGGNLFSFNGKIFRTHQKYASVLAYSNDYVTEEKLRCLSSIKSFAEPEYYKRIKENCKAYSKDEAGSVSRLCERFSCAKEIVKGDIVVLDIEVSFENKDDERPDTDRKPRRQDRIDVLLYNTEAKKLRFYEAKLFSNKDIRAKGGKAPAAVDQLKRYRSQQAKEHHNNILTQYRNHIGVINRLFGSNLPDPTSIDPEPRLYIFGFDEDQRKGRLKEIRAALQKHGVKVYAIGGPGRIDAETLWSNAK